MSAVAPRRRPGRPAGPSQATQLRARLVDEASRLYAEGGSRALSFGVVAERTGLTKATVFHYFPNKEALLLAVFETFGQRLEQTALGWFDPPPAAYAARIDRLVSSLIDFYGADPLNARILCHGLLEADARPDWQVRGQRPEVFNHFVQRFTEFVRGGIAAGELYPDRPMALILAIGGIILFEFMLPERGRGFSPDLSLVERKKEMTRLIRRVVVRPAARLEAQQRAS
jgi:AcrR family transcriptional regulator